MTHSWCVDLADVRRADAAAVGAKAANLGELIRAGFDVPSGFVLTASAYRLATEDASSVPSLSGPDVPEVVEKALRQAYQNLSPGLVAVRSSATAEDLPGATFAGQHDTHLNVDGEDAVLDAVRSCWASLFSQRAVTYRAGLRLDADMVAMGVVVQRMVAAEISGVMFTADPVTGHRDRVVVNTSGGLGESVVSGESTPDHVVIDANNQIVHSRAQRGPRMRPRDILRLGHPGQAAISSGNLVHLAELGRRIAQHFGSPQDIEWALHDGHIVVLQSRAITALPPEPVALNGVQRAIGSVVMELLPRRPYPMELTAALRPIVAKNVMRVASELTGVTLDFAAILPQRDGIVQQLLPPRLRPSLASPRRILRALVRGVRVRPGQWRSDPRLATYRRGCLELDETNVEDLPWVDLVNVPHRAQALVSTVTQLRVDYMPSAFAALGALGLALLIRPGSATVQDVLTCSTTVTRAANDELAALAEAARLIPELRDAIVAGDVPHADALAVSTPVAAAWWDSFQGFLATHGHRETTSILLVRDPCWVDSPGTVLSLIRMLMDTHDAGARRPAHQDAAAREPVGAGLVSWQQLLAEAAAQGVALREDTHYEITRVMPAVRRAIEEMGRRLVAAQALDEVHDVWMLTLEEVSAWTHPTQASAGGARAVAARRTVAYAQLTNTPLIATSTLYPPQRKKGPALVVGTAGGSGTATGRVRIISDQHEFGDLKAGEVLVCSATNPSWTPLFQRASAVVVDHGGIASHAAIVAREYAIPAIMGAATATSTLTNGQLVTVNGDTGQVIAAPSTIDQRPTPCRRGTKGRRTIPHDTRDKAQLSEKS